MKVVLATYIVRMNYEEIKPISTYERMHMSFLFENSNLQVDLTCQNAYNIYANES